MDGYVQLDEISRDILKEIGNVGTGNAVTSLSQMMEQPIELDMPSLKVVKYYKMHELLEQPEELQTGILIEVTGQLKGIFLFMLSEAFTKTVINTILGEEERNLTSLDDMECSLISELGNIMCGSYIRALSQLMDMDMDVSVPELCIDMGGAILTYPMSKWVIVSDDILLIENIFHMSGEIFKGRILFLPEQEDLGTMLSRLREQRYGKNHCGNRGRKGCQGKSGAYILCPRLLCGDLSLRPQGAHSGHGPYYTSGKEVFNPLG